MAAPVETSGDREQRQLRDARSGALHDRAVRRAGVLAVGWVLAYALATWGTTNAPAAQEVLGDLVYMLPVALAAVLAGLVARKATGRRRPLWLLLLASNVLWLTGDLIWAGYRYVLQAEAPFPSIADGAYLLSYALVPPAILVGFGGASTRRRARGLIDALVVGAAVAVAGWQLLIEPQLVDGISWATATGIASPLMGLIIVVTLLTVALAGHHQVATSVWLLGLAFVVAGVTDAGYTYLAVLHEYVPEAWLNLGWQAEAVLLCVAAFIALRHQEGDGQVAPLARDVALAPVLAVTVLVVALAGIDAFTNGADLLLLATVGLVVTGLAVRSVLSVADTRAVALRLEAALSEQERLAVTDGLTGLYNRRFFEEVLRLETDRARREGSQLALLVADLDHFKAVNDQHGHQNGDAVLAEAASRLRRALRECDVLARFGGEEFVMILPGASDETALEIAERCRRELSAQTIRLHDGQHLRITGSIGVACMPGDTTTADTLVRLADRALYAAKDRGRDRVLLAGGLDGMQPIPVPDPVALPAGLAPLERLADLVDARLGTAEHSAAMARWAGVLADALGLDAAGRVRAVLGARLHDVGKITLPDALLGKQGSLDDAEWQLMRTHPEQGERLLTGCPGFEQVAQIVRGHHERFDGTGYPDRVPSGQLSVQTRLISVCDTWAAMRADRPYACARTVEDARAELRRSAGSQHDPDLVELFLRLEAAGLVGQLDEASVMPAHAVPPCEAVPHVGQPSSASSIVAGRESPIG